MIVLAAIGAIGSFVLVVRLHYALYLIGKRFDKHPYEGDPKVVWIYILAAVVAIFLFVYLIAALFYAEKF